jgi:hypothetical protein
MPPEQEYIAAHEIKQFLKLEQFRNKVARNAMGKAKEDPERTLRRHDAEDVLAGVEFIERHADKGTEIRFAAKSVEELKAGLQALATEPEAVETMSALLDEMQASIGQEGGPQESSAADSAGAAFLQHRKYSEGKRADAARQRGKRHRW